MDKKEKEIKYPVFGSNLRQLRLSRQYTQEGLCLALSSIKPEIVVKRGAYTMWEGGFSRPEPEVEKLIANFYNITVDVLHNTPLPKAELVFKTGEPAAKRLTTFYDAPATASDVDQDMMPVTQPAGYIDTGELFGSCEAAIRIRGNSMLSGYPSGTILGLNRDYDTFFEPGELYVLETRSKRLFKRLFYHEKDLSTIICHSDNQDVFAKGNTREGKPFYPDFPVHANDVLRRFIVVGSAREHSNSMLLYSKPIKDANADSDIHELQS